VLSRGVTATRLIAALRPVFDRIHHYPPSEDSALCGKTVTDERYALVADEAVAHRAEFNRR
jgi:hypothetical protein